MADTRHVEVGAPLTNFISNSKHTKQ